ncbi:MAG: hypothetical protein EXQ70_02860 [Solirubrobacterales bacterium]|nr:hypothetical protein [Solirubrobacterales bacterium]
MNPGVRIALLVVGLAFCLLFGAMTISVATQYGFDIFSFTALLIVGMIAAGLIGAIRNPPDE